MTTGPRLRTEGSLLPGVLAVALFGLMALIVLNASFGETQGFPEGISITAEIGYAMFDLEALQSTAGNVGDTEPFLAAFLLIAVVLDAALDAALVLARRETERGPVAPLSRTASTDEARPAAADGGDESSEGEFR